MEPVRIELGGALTDVSEEELLHWVRENLAKIKGHAKKYLPYSPYELEEFIQQAYETAVRACRKNRQKSDFEKIFWSSFRIACIKMTYTQGEKIEVRHEEYREFGDEEAMATRVPAEYLASGKGAFRSMDDDCRDVIEIVDSMSPQEQKIVVSQVLALMDPRERRAWEFHFQGYSGRETAKLMGVTRQRVQNLLKRGLRRARKQLAQR
ncbi:MAG: sigma-70 family RNA polymerase sigma factor [Nitrospiraceae bacterium]|nr:sigma-70 family RNA polymerase sigma factor [Nitrospiraceae bacterium]